MTHARKLAVMSLTTLFESATLAVVNKPAGMATLHVPHSSLASLAAQLQPWRPVHRLDNATSGVVLLAKTDAAYATLRALFDEHHMTKEYLALAHGITPREQTLGLPIAHHPKKSAQMIAVTSPSVAHRSTPQPAQTHIETLQHFFPDAHRRDPFSLVRTRITTGVRHQIRVHLAQCGHPIVGDQQYGARPPPWCTRHLLHAYRLAFVDPLTKQSIDIVAPFGTDFVELSHRCGVDLPAEFTPAASDRIA